MDILSPSSSANKQLVTNADQLFSLFDGVRQLATLVDQLVEAAARGWAKAERQHHRGQLRKAYEVRKNWRKSDSKPLASLNVNETAHRKIANLSGTGRPVVQTYEPLGKFLLRHVATTITLFGDTATPLERRRAFWQLPWCELYVEALYRGEYARAKSQNCRGASRFAEAEVAEALHVSSSKVHQICGRVRIILKEREDDGLPPMTIAEFDALMRDGLSAHLTELPKFHLGKM